MQNPRLITLTTSYLTDQLSKHGYTVERQEVLDPANNLIATIPGPSSDAPILILGAHYDTVGGSPGADDNASGVAALLELARSITNLRGNSRHEIQLIFYANEEPPYFKTNAMGSLVHAQSLDEPERVVGMISLESMGYYSDEEGSQNYPFPLSLRYPSTGNFIAFVGDTSSRTFLHQMIGEFRETARIPSVGGTAPSTVQGIDWSDHWGYSQRGIPAFMVTDTAPFRNSNYHKASDTPDTLDYVRLALVVEGLDRAIRAAVAK
ncbi:MAG: M28 family peptidase [Erythrobacter sp.]